MVVQTNAILDRLKLELQAGHFEEPVEAKRVQEGNSYAEL